MTFDHNPQDYADFLTFMGQSFEKAGFRTKLLLGDVANAHAFRWYAGLVPILARDPELRRFVDGLGIEITGGWDENLATYRLWADLAASMNLPLLITSFGRPYSASTVYLFDEMRIQQQVLRELKPSGLIMRQFVAEKSGKWAMVWDGKIVPDGNRGIPVLQIGNMPGREEDVRPGMRFWFAKQFCDLTPAGHAVQMESDHPLVQVTGFEGQRGGRDCLTLPISNAGRAREAAVRGLPPGVKRLRLVRSGAGADRPFEEEKRTMSTGTISVVEHGAVADGQTDNTQAIQAAVNACAAAGGGRVVVPAGVFVSGPIFLKSNIEFHLEPGAVLRGSRRMGDYPVLDVSASGYHIDRTWHASLLTGCNLENVSITGKGVLDGQGDVWWKARDAKELKFIRPMVIFLFDCERVRIDGVKLIDSPSWNMVSILCRNETIHDVSIQNPWKSYFNCDGINLMSCRNVRISNCYVDTGDDGICLKTLPDFGMVCGGAQNGEWKPDYSKPRIPCEDVLIENCVVERAHSGVGLWAEVIGGIRNVSVNNCLFDGARTGIRIARYPHPGGYVKDIRISNIVMRRVEWAIELSTQLTHGKMEPGPDPETTPVFSNIHFSNITATQASIACEMFGMPKNPVRDISFSNLHIEADQGFNLRHAKNILFDNVTVESRGVPLLAEDVKNLEWRRFQAPVFSREQPVLQVTRVRDSWAHGCTAAPGTGVFLGLVGHENQVRLESNRLDKAGMAEAPVVPANSWNSCSHAYTGSRMIRDTGDRNTWLPVSAAVMAAIRRRWTPEQVDRIHSTSRVEPNARNGAEVADPNERRRIYIIEARDVAERLVIFEDGELLRAVTDPDFHAHVWKGM